MEKNSTLIFWGGLGRFGKEFYRYAVEESQAFPAPDYYCDGNADLHGTFARGKKVLSPAQLYELADNEYSAGRRLTVVICTKGFYTLEIITALKKREFEAKGDILLAEAIYARIYRERHRAAIEHIEGSFTDDISKSRYRDIWNNLEAGRVLDFSLVSSSPYFDNDVIKNLHDDDIIVDAGVCDGEEIDRVLMTNPRAGVIAFEPYNVSMQKLAAKYHGNDRIVLYEMAPWHKKEQLSFNTAKSNTGIRASAAISEYGFNTIKAVTLDEVLEGNRVSIIKMDIEGAEYHALLGARRTIERYLPKLAICLYHSIEDYVRIPELIFSWGLNYNYYFRQHSVTNTESVFYCLPA